MKSFSLLLVGLLFFSCNSPAQKSNTTETKTFEVTKTDAEWKAQLSPEAYQVLRHEATEPAFSSPLNDNHQKGTYVCAGCGTPLYESEHKFDSGTGWPSFDRVIEGNVAFSTDTQERRSTALHAAGIWDTCLTTVQRKPQEKDTVLTAWP